MNAPPKESALSNSRKHNNQKIKNLIEGISQVAQIAPSKRRSLQRHLLPCDSKCDLVALSLKTAKTRIYFVDTGNKKTVMRAMVRELHGIVEAMNDE